MKRVTGFVLIALLAMTVIPATAQLKFGVKGGLNISTIHFDSEIVSSDNITGFHIGPTIMASVPILGIGFDAAILYSQKGTSVGNTDVRADYIDVPVNLRWRLDIPLIKPYIAAGPYVGFRVGGDKVWNVVSDQIEAKTFGAGLNFGAGVELFNHLHVGFNYGLGLTDNFSHKTTASTSTVSDGKSRGWSITAAIYF